MKSHFGCAAAILVLATAAGARTTIMVVNNEVVLVDPATSEVVEIIRQ